MNMSYMHERRPPIHILRIHVRLGLEQQLARTNATILSRLSANSELTGDR